MTGDRSRVREAPRAGSRNGRGAARSAAEDRGRAELARGRRQFLDGPVDDARETLLLAASLLAADAPDRAEAARLCAVDAAWASGDVMVCLTTLDGTDTPGPADEHAAPGIATAEAFADEGGASPSDQYGTTSEVFADRGGAPTADEYGTSTTEARGAPATGGGSAPAAVRDADGPPSSDPTERTVPPTAGGQPELSGPAPGPGWACDPFFRDYRDACGPCWPGGRNTPPGRCGAYWTGRAMTTGRSASCVPRRRRCCSGTSTRPAPPVPVHSPPSATPSAPRPRRAPWSTWPTANCAPVAMRKRAPTRRRACARR
ncbi:hypothetical protein ACFWJP_09965 [Streptomyces hawaiiensis]|uniref:hypothetical protein n=1 Tax=Streptomyces hawaiiensis TaxID=67305 RepID=UPI003655DF59